MAVANHIGHDKRGNQTYVRDVKGNEVIEEKPEISSKNGKNGTPTYKRQTTRRKVADDKPLQIAQENPQSPTISFETNGFCTQMHAKKEGFPRAVYARVERIIGQMDPDEVRDHARAITEAPNFPDKFFPAAAPARASRTPARVLMVWHAYRQERTGKSQGPRHRKAPGGRGVRVKALHRRAKRSIAASTLLLDSAKIWSSNQMIEQVQPKA